MTEEVSLRIARPDAPLGEKVVAAVRDAISVGVLAPGQRLTERELMERTGVSRTSVREALRQLATQGLVERLPNGGMRVAILDRAAIEHIYEARNAIETAAAELFISKASNDEYEELIALGRRYREAVKTGQNLLDAAPSRAYDDLLLRGAHNPILAEMLKPLHTRVQGLRRLSMSMPGRSRESCVEILEIIDAVVARDLPRTIAASRRHIAAAAASAQLATVHPTVSSAG